MGIIVIESESQFIFQHGNGVGKINAVFAEIAGCLWRVPFITHIVIICTSVHRFKETERRWRDAQIERAARGDTPGL